MPCQPSEFRPTRLGLADELLNVLTKIRGLRVASRTSAFYFKGKDVDIPTVAQSVVKELRATPMGDKSDSVASADTKAEVRAAVTRRGENAEACRLYLQGRLEDALASAEREVLPDFRLWAIAMAQHALGRPAESDAALRNMIADHGDPAAYQLAEVHGYRGDVDRGFEWLERAYRQRDPGQALSLQCAEPGVIRPDAVRAGRASRPHARASQVSRARRARAGSG